MGTAATQKVLVVDDDKDDRESLAEFLRVKNYSYDTAATGQDAIVLAKKAKEEGNPFDVILMDQVLGGLSDFNGISAIPMIKEISPSSEVIVMTAYGDRVRGMDARNKGAYRYIYKPTKLSEIVTILEYIDEWRRLDDQLSKCSKERDQLQQIIKNVSCGISIIDRTWRILYMNKKQRDMLRHAEVGGICWVEYNQTDRREPCEWCPVKYIFDEGLERKYNITASPDKHGVLHYYDVEAVPIHDKKGRVIAALEAVTDVTGRESLYSMQKRIHGTLDLEDRLRIILQSIRNLGYDRARLYLLSDDGKSFDGRLQVGDGLAIDIKEIRLDREHDGFSREILEKKEPIIFRKPWKYPPQHAEELKKDEAGAWLAVPLVDQQKKVLGQITVDNLYSKRELTQGDIERLRPLMDHAANAIARSREFEDIRLRAEQLQNLRRIDTGITTELQMDPVLEMIVTSCKDLTGALSSFVRLLKEGGLEIGAGVGPYKDIAPKVLSLTSDKDQNSVSVRAVKTGKPAFANWREENTHLMQQKHRARIPGHRRFFEEVKSWGSFPLIFGSDILGVLSLESDREDFFTNSMKSLIFDFCRRAAIAVRNAKLFENMEDGLEARARLMNALSHDMRAPLSHMQRQMDILKLPGASEEMRERALDVIRDELNWYDQMFDKLVTFSRVEVGALELKKEEIELRSVVEDALEIWSFRINEKKLKIEKRFPNSEVKVKADRAGLREVLNNLVENAIKYTPRNGYITLRVKDEESKAIVEVEDTGVGIADEHKERIFELFYNVDAPQINAKGGAGIGLSNCKHIVEQHGGEIGFESQVDVGSRFWFSLSKGGD